MAKNGEVNPKRSAAIRRSWAKRRANAAVNGEVRMIKIGSLEMRFDPKDQAGKAMVRSVLDHVIGK